MGHRMLPIAFFPDRPRCHGNKIWDKMGYNSACVRDFLRDFCAYRGVFGDGPSYAISSFHLYSWWTPLTWWLVGFVWKWAANEICRFCCVPF